MVRIPEVASDPGGQNLAPQISLARVVELEQPPSDNVVNVVISNNFQSATLFNVSSETRVAKKAYKQQNATFDTDTIPAGYEDVKPDNTAINPDYGLGYPPGLHNSLLRNLRITLQMNSAARREI